MMKRDPELFEEYHEGYRAQIAEWPVKPIDQVVGYLQEDIGDAKVKIADLGCGDGVLYERMHQGNVRVLSYDLVSVKPFIIECDIANLPLRDRTVHYCVFCLSLMGTNHVSFVKEAHRILRKRGQLVIAEVASRMKSRDEFVFGMRRLGFRLVVEDLTNSHFVFFVFRKVKAREGQVERLLEAGKYKAR